MERFEKYMTMQKRKAQAYSYLGKDVVIGIDRPIGTPHPKHNHILYPINYGYIPGVLGGDNEELDVYLLGVDEIVTEYPVKIIAIVHRHNDEEDKLVAAPRDMYFSKAEIEEQINFQEQFYNKHVEVIDEYNFGHLSAIAEGFSTDKKYYAKSHSGVEYLIRESTLKSNAHHLMLANVLKQLEATDVNFSKLLNVNYEYNKTVTVYEWINGDQLSDVLPHLSTEDQYSLGEVAGKYLKTIHNVDISKLVNFDNIQSWEDKFNQKLERNIDRYNKLSLNVEGVDYLLNYIEANRHLLKGRSQVFQHGDYHINNMLFANEEIVIIDFDRHDIGDAWEEFNRIIWSVNVSKYFASGIINGYFNNKVPDQFWNLLLLYISVNTINSLTWAHTYFIQQYPLMIDNLNNVLKWYNNCNEVIPTWYVKADI